MINKIMEINFIFNEAGYNYSQANIHDTNETIK
jgi:hypothetical protein